MGRTVINVAHSLLTFALSVAVYSRASSVRDKAFVYFSSDYSKHFIDSYLLVRNRIISEFYDPLHMAKVQLYNWSNHTKTITMDLKYNRYASLNNP